MVQAADINVPLEALFNRTAALVPLTDVFVGPVTGGSPLEGAWTKSAAGVVLVHIVLIGRGGDGGLDYVPGVGVASGGGGGHRGEVIDIWLPGTDVPDQIAYGLYTTESILNFGSSTLGSTVTFRALCGQDGFDGVDGVAGDGGLKYVTSPGDPVHRWYGTVQGGRGGGGDTVISDGVKHGEASPWLSGGEQGQALLAANGGLGGQGYGAGGGGCGGGGSTLLEAGGGGGGGYGRGAWDGQTVPVGGTRGSHGSESQSRGKGAPGAFIITQFRGVNL